MDYQYWADGKLKQKTDGRGWKTYFYYDDVGRLMHKLYDNLRRRGKAYQEKLAKWKIYILYL